MTEPTDFHKKTRDLLDESAEGLDAATLSRLHRARNEALVSRGFLKRLPGAWQWSGAGAVAASLALVVFYTGQVPEPLPVIYDDPAQQAVAEEMELMDDLDFVAWLVLEESEANDVVNRS